MRHSILCCFGIWGLTACTPTTPSDVQVPEIKVISPETSGQDARRNYTFLSEPFRITELSFRTGGPIQTFNIQNGQFFHKGELMATLDDRDFRIKEQRTGAIYRQAKADFQRIANLYEEDNISGMNYEKAKADHEKAKADYETAVNELNDTRLYAPFDGYVQQTYTERYQDIQPTTPIVRFIDLSRIKVEAYIPEEAALKYRTGNGPSCTVTFNALPNQKYHPTNTYLTQSVTDNNISYLFTAILDNPDNTLLGGMSGTLELLYQDTLTHPSQSVLVPQSAVCHDETSGTFVWRVNRHNHIDKVPVRTGKIQKNGRIEILSGITTHDRIAVTRLHILTENDTITVRD